MDCREIKRLMVPFLESELSERDRLIIEAHLHECVDCQKEKAALEQTWSMLDGFQAPKVSSNFTWNLMERIREQEERRPKFNFAFPEINIRFGYRVLVPAMVSACALIVAYLFVQNNLNQEQQVAEDFSPEQASIAQAKREVPAESEVKVAEVAPAATKEDVKISSVDEEIIRNLDAYKNAELYKNYALVEDLEVVENSNEGTS
jgi:anti-sigma factor RsiW